jgi:hypothetical protein
MDRNTLDESNYGMTDEEEEEMFKEAREEGLLEETQEK